MFYRVLFLLTFSFTAASALATDVRHKSGSSEYSRPGLTSEERAGPLKSTYSVSDDKPDAVDDKIWSFAKSFCAQFVAANGPGLIKKHGYSAFTNMEKNMGGQVGNQILGDNSRKAKNELTAAVNAGLKGLSYDTDLKKATPQQKRAVAEPIKISGGSSGGGALFAPYKYIEGSFDGLDFQLHVEGSRLDDTALFIGVKIGDDTYKCE